MRMRVRGVAALLAALPMMAACATKGDLRRAVNEQRAALEAERTARASADSSLAAELGVLRTDVEALKRDLQALRTDFRAEITAMNEGLQFAMPVHFAFDVASLSPEAEPMLQRFAQVAQKYYPESKVTVEGFADPAGTASYNRALSQERAENVKNYLTTLGLRGDLLQAVGYGENRQVVPGAWGDEAGAESNRRVVFVIESRGNPMTEGIALATPQS